MSLTEEQLKRIASQLSNPSGADGISVANMMHDSNFGMTKSTFEALHINDHDQVLELGHGNGKHIIDVLNLADKVVYFGLEISELMQQEAETLNHANAASFYLYNGTQIPFDAQMFDKAMTVNTIYFWEKPIDLLNEVYRVLKIGGLFCIGFAQKEFMETLPFTQHSFNLYDDTKLAELVNETPFKLEKLNDYTETIKSKTGETVDRRYTVAALIKA